MKKTQPIRPKEGLSLFRLIMVLGSLSPLFLLLAIRGIPDSGEDEVIINGIFTCACYLLGVIPTCIIYCNLKSAKTADEPIIAGVVTDSRENIVVYLFALFIPLYQNSYSGLRDIIAAIVLIFLVIFILFHLNLHYLNIYFAFFGYRVFTIEAPQNGNEFNGRTPFIILSQRSHIPIGTVLHTHQISDTVFIE